MDYKQWIFLLLAIPTIHSQTLFYFQAQICSHKVLVEILPSNYCQFTSQLWGDLFLNVFLIDVHQVSINNVSSLASTPGMCKL